MVPEIWSATDKIFVILGRFLPFYFPNPENQNFEKVNKVFGYVMSSFYISAP